MKRTLMAGVALTLIFTSAWAQVRDQSDRAAGWGTAPPKLVDAPLPNLGADMRQLQALVLAALERSPGTKVAAANWHASLQSVEEAKGALWPQLEVNANTGALKVEGSGLAQRANLGAVASYNLLDFGRTREQIQGRERHAQSLQAQILAERESTTYQTVLAYLQLVKYDRMIAIYEHHILELQDLVGKLQDIVAVFVGRSSELTQARTRLGQAREGLLTLKAKRREVQLALIKQVGRDSGGRLGEAPLPFFPMEDLGNLVAQGLERHPSVTAARAEVLSLQAQAAEAHAAQQPQVDVQLAKQLGRDVVGIKSPTQLYISAKWAAFQGFGDRAAERALQERANAVEAQINQQQTEIDFNIRAAVADFEAQGQQLDELTELVKATDQVRKDYYDQWKDLGKRSLLDVLTAQSEHLNTLLSLASAQVDRALAVAKARYEAANLKTWLVGQDATALADGSSGPTSMSMVAVETAPAQEEALTTDDDCVSDCSTRVAQKGDVSG
jgi:adhesin transport system outer membrane protein